MQQNVRDEILAYVKKQSERYNTQNINACTASAISQELSVSRSLASHYLNELVENGILLKILSRPVFFLHRQTLEENYGVVIDEPDFLSIDAFQDFLHHATGAQSSFAKLVGYDTSLAAMINQSTSALLYPPCGLPMILYGEHGTGKTEFVSLLFDYGLSHQIFDNHSKLIHLYLDDESTEKLNQKMKDALRREHGQNGIFCLHHAQLLDHDQRQLLATYIHRMKRRANREGFLPVLCMESDPHTLFTAEFLQQFPVILNVPSIEERSLEEKEELLMRTLKREEARLGKPLEISTAAFRALCHHVYPYNRIDLDKVITLACANASSVQGKTIQVEMVHLPFEVAVKSSIQPVGHENSGMIAIRDFSVDRDTQRLIQIFEAILKELDHRESIKAAITHSYQLVKEYYDTMIFRHLYVNSQIKVIERMLIQIFEDIDLSFHIHLPSHCSYVLARVIYAFGFSDGAIRSWEKEHHDQLLQHLAHMREACPSEDFIASKIHQLMRENLDIKLNEANTILLLIYLNYFNRSAFQKNYLGMIVSHGYATASSICDAVNTLIGEYVFDAIDMPLDTGNEEIVRKIDQYLQKLSIKKGIIILVDMGSLESIGEQLAANTNREVGVINNVSTKMALQIGYDILQEKDMKEILERAVHLENSYTLMDVSNKQDAILFTSESGEYAAHHVMELFQESLGEKLDIDMMTYEYADLQKYGQECPIFAQHHVLFIAGTMDPRVENVPFIAVENIISGTGEQEIFACLSQYLTQEQIAQMNQRLLINFSLQNVMENITILNPKKLMDNVVEAIERLEDQLHLHLENKVKIGMYLHVSCLVERLVTKQSVEETFDLHRFMEEKTDFIRSVENCFAGLCEHYHVALPVNEILYIYEYIVRDEKEIEKYRGK